MKTKDIGVKNIAMIGPFGVVKSVQSNLPLRLPAFKDHLC